MRKSLFEVMQLIINTRGYEQYFEVIGNGVPLLCLPAFPFSHVLYREQRSLADIAQLILPDYRGTGHSAFTEGPYLMELLAEDMVAVLDSLQIEQAIVLGVSMGAYVAFALYRAFPERFSALIIADSRAEADSALTAQRREETVQALRNEGTIYLRERINDLFAESTKRENPTLVAEMQTLVMAENANGLAEITRGMALRPDSRELLSKIAAPTLIICGEEDTVSPVSGMQVMAQQINNAQFQLLPAAGHLSPLENPYDFNHVLREFIMRQQINIS